MAKGKLLLGLDIGSSSAKICQLKEGRNGYELESVDRELFPADAIVDGSIIDRSGVAKALRTLINRNKIKQKQCAIAISGFSVIVKRLSLPNQTEEELSNNIRWEVEQHIPYNYNEVVYDTVILGRNPNQNTMDILLVASKREVVNDYISVAKEAGLDVKVVDVASFALQNMVETVYGDITTAEGVCTGIVNVGAFNTSMTMMVGGITTFTREMTIGGNQITEEIQKKLGISREEAEAFKTGDVSSGNAVIPREVEDIIIQVSETIANEIKRSLMFFYETSGQEHIDQLILCGGVIKNRSTLRVIESTLGENIIVANPFAKMKFDDRQYTSIDLEKLALESAVSLGLALRRSVE